MVIKEQKAATAAAGDEGVLCFCKDGDSGIEMPQRCSALRSTGEGVPGTKTTPANGGSGVAKEFGMPVSRAQLEDAERQARGG